MELTQIVNKLVGQISATGDSSRDGERLENLKISLELRKISKKETPQKINSLGFFRLIALLAVQF